MATLIVALLPYAAFFVLLFTVNAIVLHFRTPPDERPKAQGSFMVNLLAIVVLGILAVVVGTWLGNHA